MSQNVWFHALALAELEEAVLYFETVVGDSALASAFVSEVNHALALVLSYPEASPVLYPPVRQKSLHRFPYHICYEPMDKKGIYVYAIAHDKRHPHYWLERSKPE